MNKKASVWSSYGLLICMICGILLGCVVGAMFPNVKDADGNVTAAGASVLKPLGQIFINLMFCIVVPMALLGLDVRLLTVFGDDLNAQKIAASCAELGIDVSHSPFLPDEHTSTYLFINDERGDMSLAVNDMDIYRRLTPQFLAQRQKLLDGAQVVAADTNPPAETLRYLADHCTAPIFCDPVSTVKAEKLRPILGKLHTLKPNRIEAELLSGVKIRDKKSLRLAAERLLETGLRRVFISLGNDGVFAADHERAIHLPVIPGTMVNTTGCGDAFMAAIIYAYLRGTDLANTARMGLAAASIAMESDETINPAMREDELLRRVETVKML